MPAGRRPTARSRVRTALTAATRFADIDIEGSEAVVVTPTVDQQLALLTLETLIPKSALGLELAVRDPAVDRSPRLRRAWRGRESERQAGGLREGTVRYFRPPPRASTWRAGVAAGTGVSGRRRRRRGGLSAHGPSPERLALAARAVAARGARLPVRDRARTSATRTRCSRPQELRRRASARQVPDHQRRRAHDRRIGRDHRVPPRRLRRGAPAPARPAPRRGCATPTGCTTRKARPCRRCC